MLKTLPGWKCDIRGIKKYEDLPENCRNYIEFVEKEIGFPITMISNGPGRDDIITATNNQAVLEDFYEKKQDSFSQF